MELLLFFLSHLVYYHPTTFNFLLATQHDLSHNTIYHCIVPAILDTALRPIPTNYTTHSSTTRQSRQLSSSELVSSVFTEKRRVPVTRTEDTSSQLLEVYAKQSANDHAAQTVYHAPSNTLVTTALEALPRQLRTS